MSMPGLPELVLLAVLALLIFGPDRLPGIVRNVGKAVGTVRREANRAVNDFKTASDYEEVRTAARELRGEAESLRREGREAGEQLRRVVDDRPAGDGAGTERDGAGPAGAGGEAGEQPMGAGGRRAAEPAPFDPDTP